jgi:hypothetical protein
MISKSVEPGASARSGGYEEGGELREGRGLLVPQIFQGLQCHLMRGGGIAGLLEKNQVGLALDRNPGPDSAGRHFRSAANCGVGRAVLELFGRQRFRRFRVRCTGGRATVPRVPLLPFGIYKNAGTLSGPEEHQETGDDCDASPEPSIDPSRLPRT